MAHLKIMQNSSVNLIVINIIIMQSICSSMLFCTDIVNMLKIMPA